MSLSHAESVSLAAKILAGLAQRTLPVSLHTWLTPSFLAIPAVAAATKDSRIRVGAQDLWTEQKGAFTGEVSASQLKEVGASYVLVGHSERRHIIGESNERIRQKVDAALSEGLKVILCIGETKDQRLNNTTHEILSEQIQTALSQRSTEACQDIILAYEPVWAIGTGIVATPEQVADAHDYCTTTVSSLTAAVIPVLYGGSMTPENASTLLSIPTVAGGLIGGASLKAESYLALVDAALS